MLCRQIIAVYSGKAYKRQKR